MLFLGLKTSQPFTRIYIDDVNMECSVEDIRVKASQHSNIPLSDIVLVYAGNILKDGLNLTETGLRPGITIQVLKKSKIKEPVTSKIKEADVSRIVSAFKRAKRAVNYRSAIQRISSQPSVLEKIIAASPGLKDDPVALAIVQDPELVTQLSDTATARKVLEEHPSLAEAAQYIVTLVQSEGVTANRASSGYFYSLESLSDDEDMDSSQGESSAITSAQLASALAAAQSDLLGASTSSRSSTASSASSPSITSEMLGRALGQAMASSTHLGTTESGSTPAPAALPAGAVRTDLEDTSRRLAQHLQQMHELGLRDDTLNLQALGATDWNVQEAINLVFSGAMADLNDSEMD